MLVQSGVLRDNAAQPESADKAKRTHTTPNTTIMLGPPVATCS